MPKFTTTTSIKHATGERSMMAKTVTQLADPEPVPAPEPEPAPVLVAAPEPELEPVAAGAGAGSRGRAGGGARGGRGGRRRGAAGRDRRAAEEGRREGRRADGFPDLGHHGRPRPARGVTDGNRRARADLL